MAEIRAEYAAAGNEAIYEHLKVCLQAGSNRPAYHQLAGECGMTEGAVKVAVHRLRTRYRQRLKSEIAATVSQPVEVEEEIRDLFAALGR